MIGTSGRKTAAAIGITESALRKAKKAGRVKALADGSYDVETTRAQMAGATDPVRTRVRTKVCTEAAGTHTGAQSPTIAEDDVRAAISLIRRVLEEEGADFSGVTNFNMARTAETILKARERALRLERDAGRVVDVRAARRSMFALARMSRDQWSVWPAKIAPRIGPELGVDSIDLAIILDREVRLQLDESSRSAFTLKNLREGEANEESTD